MYVFYSVYNPTDICCFYAACAQIVERFQLSATFIQFSCTQNVTALASRSSLRYAAYSAGPSMRQQQSFSFFAYHDHHDQHQSYCCVIAVVTAITHTYTQVREHT